MPVQCSRLSSGFGGRLGRSALGVLLLGVPQLLGARIHDETKHDGPVRCAAPARSHDTTVHMESDSSVPQRQAISAPRPLPCCALRCTALRPHLPAPVLTFALL